MIECAHCKSYPGMTTMLGDYNVGFFCSRPECLAVLKSKRDKSGIDGGVATTERVRVGDKVQPHD